MTRTGFHWVLVTVAWALLAAYVAPDGQRGVLLLHISGALWLGDKLARADRDNP